MKSARATRFLRELSTRGREAGISFWLGMLGLLILFLALRWNTCDAPLVRDEGEYAYAAQLVERGLRPYEHAFVQKPPMVIYSYVLADLLAPRLFWFPRVLASLFAAGATVLLGFIARREFGKGCALPSMWLVTPMLLLPRVDQNTANTEMFLLLPLMGTVAIYVFGRGRQAGKGAWFTAGLLGAITLLYKYTALPVLLLVFAAWWFEETRQPTVDARVRLQHLLYALLGVGVAGLLGVGWFLARDGGWPLWECTVEFNRLYAGTKNFGFTGLWFWLKRFWIDWWILFLAPAVLIFKPPRRIWFWVAVFLTSWLTTAASRYGHYYIVVMPFWALLVAVAIRHVSELVSAERWGRWVSRLGVTVVVGLLCWPALPTLRRSREQLEKERPEILSGCLVVAERIAKLSSPGDYVFVAGSEPQILSYADRLSPTRFVIVYPFTMPTRLAEKYQWEAIAALDRRPPELIVFVSEPSSWLRTKETPAYFFNYLSQLLENRYEPAGGYVIEATGPRWKESISEAELPRSTLRLFKRKKATPL